MYKGGSMEILSVETVTADGIYQNIPLNLQRVYHYEAVNTLVLWTPLIYFRGGGTEGVSYDRTCITGIAIVDDSRL